MQRTALILTLALGALLGWREIASPDLGFHFSTARWILANRSFPVTDFLTYTVSDHAYIDLQWLFQLLMYGSYKLGGTFLIVAETTALTLLFGALLLVRTQRRCGRLPLSALALLILFFLSTLWEPRPHLLSWILGSCILLILEEYSRGSRRWLPLLPLVMLVWVNSHSLFILGLVIIGSYVATSLLSALWNRRPADRRLLLWALAAGLACLINPYHIKGVLFPLTQFRDIQNASGFNSALTGVAELTSPFRLDGYFQEGRFVLFQPRFFWHLFTVLAAAGCIGSLKKSRLAEWILCAGFFYIFWKANKNFGYFVMAVFPMVASGLSDLGSRITDLAVPSGRTRRSWKRAGEAGCIAATAFLIALVWTEQLYALDWSPHRRGTGFNRIVLPVGACEFLNTHQIKGRILNCWADGGYIAWTTGQEVFIYSHGEVMGSAFYRRYAEARQPQGFPALLQQWKPSVAVVSFKTAPYWLYHLDRENDWRLVYADLQTAVFLHASAAPDIPALPRPQPGAAYPLFDTQTAEELIRRAADAKPPGFRVWLQGSRAYPSEEMILSAFYLQTAELDACIGISLQGLQKTDFLVPELMLNLGHALNARRRYDLADVCFAAFLRADQNPVIAAEIRSIRQMRSGKKN